jgi:hypothetical protein
MPDRARDGSRRAASRAGPAVRTVTGVRSLLAVLGMRMRTMVVPVSTFVRKGFILLAPAIPVMPEGHALPRRHGGHSLDR